jgi:CheY-like chemotaxis protein
MSKHVLIAEDDTILADMMGKILSKKDLRVTVTYNGQEALEIMEEEVPDLLLLDILMPVVDGHAVLETMKKKELNCPVIVLSNLSDKKTKEKCRRMHAKNYFVKSDMDDDALWLAVKMFLFSPSPTTYE